MKSARLASRAVRMTRSMSGSPAIFTSGLNDFMRCPLPAARIRHFVKRACTRIVSSLRNTGRYAGGGHFQSNPGYKEARHALSAGARRSRVGIEGYTDLEEG